MDAHISLWQQPTPEARAHPRFPGEHRDFLPAHIEPILARNHFDGAILFTTGCSTTELQTLASWCADSSLLLGISARWPSAASAHTPPQYLEATLAKGILRGVWSHAGAAGLAEAARFCDAHRLALDLLPGDSLSFADSIRPIATAHPSLPVVLAHVASPPLASHALNSWQAQMLALAAFPNVYCKLSALWSSSLEDWNLATLQSLFHFLIEHFGEHRLLFGSDWPYCLPAHSWKETLARFTQSLGPRSMEFREAVLGNTAARVYGVPSTPKHGTLA